MIRANASREYVRPVVRALPMTTAHPSREAWFAPGRPTAAQAPAGQSPAVPAWEGFHQRQRQRRAAG
jgi:hypothetical protein